jgi:signal transduction histidine kinase
MGPCHNRAVATPSDRRANLVRIAAGPFALAYALGALAVARGPGEFTTYAGRSDLTAAVAMVPGLALILAGLVVSIRRSMSRVGYLALVAGVTWFAPFWVGWTGGPPLVRSLGMVVAGFAFPLLLHIVLAYPSGRLHYKVTRALVASVYLEAVLFSLGRAIFRDPYFDPKCWDNCTVNVFLVRSLPRVARTIQTVDLWFVGVTAGAFAVFCIARLLAATGPARRALWPLTAAGVLFGAAMAAHSIALFRATEDPSDPAFLSIFIIQGAAVVLLAGGLLWTALRARVQRRSVGRIVADLGDAPAPGSLEAALARAVGDPELRMAYWLPDSGRYVDPRGNLVAEPVAGLGRSVTALVRDGREVAVVTHSASVADLEREIGADVRLALDNERLQAEVLTQMVDLRASRARIVETGDAERRRLERNLHDGAQQRLLALSYDLRLAAAAAQTDGEADTASLLADATAEAQAALGELRDLAHGIYPAILTEAGVASAIATLADGAPLPVEIAETDEERYPAPVETAVYLVVAEAIEDAAAREASYVTLSLLRDGDRLVVSVEDDGSERISPMVHLADRVGALGGSLDVEPRKVRAEVPCA